MLTKLQMTNQAGIPVWDKIRFQVEMQTWNKILGSYWRRLSPVSHTVQWRVSEQIRDLVCGQVDLKLSIDIRESP